MYGPESKCEKLNQRSKGEGGRGERRNWEREVLLPEKTPCFLI